MKRVCSWCQKYLGDIPSSLHSEHTITHGICDTCLANLFSDRNIDFIPFLNSIPAPIVLIDDNNTYLAANDAALAILKKDNVSLINKRTGDVFTCENAKLTGGCGHTKKCGGCQMLQLINNTYSGKDSFQNVPVTLTRKKGNAREELNLQLSTEKVKKLDLLRIDEMSTITLDS